MPSDRLDEIAAALDDVATTLEEMKENCAVKSDAIDQMRRAIEKASDAIDRIENRQSDTGSIATKET